jgi:enhancing lycopene biosynthesis protein 2
MSDKVAVILSGSGVFDGSELHEAVALLMALAQCGQDYHCYAPDIDQIEVVDHLKQTAVPNEKRSVLQESARIARGKVLPLTEAVAHDVNAAFFPGGFGVAKQLSDFARSGDAMSVQEDVLAFGRAMVALHKPMGFMCIAPILMPHFYPQGIRCTVGDQGEVADAIAHMGGVHVVAQASEVVVDSKHLAASTPAYMLAEHPSEVLSAAQALVKHILTWL